MAAAPELKVNVIIMNEDDMRKAMREEFHAAIARLSWPYPPPPTSYPLEVTC